MTYVSNLPTINYGDFAIVAATPKIVSGSTNSLSVALTFTSGTSNTVIANETATITITGFMAITPSTTQINQVQESLNRYILSLILVNNNLGIKAGIATAPNNFVSSGVTPSTSQKVLSYNDLIFGTDSPVNFLFPNNLVASNVNVIVSNNITPGSSAFIVMLQVNGATIPGITVLVLSSTSNSVS